MIIVLMVLTGWCLVSALGIALIVRVSRRESGAERDGGEQPPSPIVTVARRAPLPPFPGPRPLEP
jgi:hypothetical protein